MTLRVPWQRRFAEHFATGETAMDRTELYTRVLFLGLVDTFGPLLHSETIAIQRQIVAAVALEVAGEWWATAGVIWQIWQEIDRAFADALCWGTRTRALSDVRGDDGRSRFCISNRGRRWLAVHTRSRPTRQPTRLSELDALTPSPI